MITVFTPTYNRGYILKKLYESLKSQSCKNFEWLVIDDGSEDNTALLLQEWESETSSFPIIYERLKHGGKHRAINRGVKMAQGDAFFIVDSDDYLAEDAIAFVDEKFAQIADDKGFAGISGLKCSYVDGTLMGGIPDFEDYVDATNLERWKYKLLGDKAEIYKTDILRRYPFPEYENENFITEDVVWNSIALDGYMIRWYMKKIYYCDYLKDGITYNLYEVQQKNPLGWAEYIRRRKQHESEATIFRQIFQFFEAMHLFYTKEELKCLLEIKESEHARLFETRESILGQLKKKVQKECAHSIALYGMGMNARRLQSYLEKAGLSVLYYIDRNFMKNTQVIPAYSIEMELPHVDSICITSKKIPVEKELLLKEKMPYSEIWRIEELGDIWG